MEIQNMNQFLNVNIRKMLFVHKPQNDTMSLWVEEKSLGISIHKLSQTLDLYHYLPETYL